MNENDLSRIQRFAVLNTTAERIPPYAIMELDYTGASATTASGEISILKVKKPTGAVSPYRYVFNGPDWIEASRHGVAFFAPLVLASLDTSDAVSHGDVVGPVSGSWLLGPDGSGWVVKSEDAGEAYTDTDVASYWVEREDTKDHLFRFTLTANMTGGSATANLLTMGGGSTGETVTVLDPLGVFSDMESGDSGICYEQGGAYYALLPQNGGGGGNVVDGAYRLLGTLSAGLAITDTTKAVSSAVKLSDWADAIPDPFEPGNPFKFHAVAGDQCVVEWDTTADAFKIVQILPVTARRIRFRLLADWPLGLGQNLANDGVEADRIQVIEASPGYSGALPTVFTLRDRYNRAHNAQQAVSSIPADEGIAEWNAGAGEFDIIEITHRATQALGTIYNGWDNDPSVPAQFAVTVPQTGLFDGSHPNNTTSTIAAALIIDVENIYDWEFGTFGHEVRIERDPQTGDWIPLQMKCGY